MIASISAGPCSNAGRDGGRGAAGLSPVPLHCDFTPTKEDDWMFNLDDQGMSPRFAPCWESLGEIDLLSPEELSSALESVASGSLLSLADDNE